ncbi:ArsR/SmtB family transcription factor [Gorillibacterium massiliense]|uniref:ArsR/SmtB family transcription factor n=1 Tax=Gorillibacterium massiliense TaxID=1280390 RepID=UPI0004B4B728|nr:helix-turn-helix domain-containing protein [Gorillibacterium massiliense]
MEKMVLTSLEDIKVYSDPYRLQILYAFDRFRRPATVKEIADAMGEVPAKVHYHVKKLEKIGILKMVATKEINGIIAKYYEAFDGQIHISHTDMADPLRKVIASEAQKVLSSVFEEARQKFVRNTSGEKQPYANLTNKLLFMTKEEAMGLMDQILTLCQAYEKKREDVETDTFDLMMAISREMPTKDA